MEEEKQNVLSGNIDVLKSMIQTLEVRDGLKEKMNLLANEEKKLQNELKRLHTKQEEETKQELEQARQIATAEEDKILKEEEKKQKEIKQKRERAKNQGIRSRMEQETRDYVELNRENSKKIRKLLKENDLPLLCNSKAYFIMYSPENIKEWIIRVTVLLLLTIALPGVIIWIKNPWWLWKILIWLIIDFVVVATYITIYLLSKDKDIGALEQIRDIREKVEETNRKIRRIKLDIKRDTDESSYGLDSFDTDLKTVEEKITQTQAKKEEKLQKFKETNEEIVIEQVKKAYKEPIEATQTQLETTAKEYDSLNIQLAENQAIITDNYEKYIDPSLLNKDKLQKLLIRMETGQASTIQEAIQLENN